MTRVQHLLRSLGWSQMRLAREVGVTQTTIWRLARGDAESGPMRLALNQIADAHGLPHLRRPAQSAPVGDGADLGGASAPSFSSSAPEASTGASA